MIRSDGRCGVYVEGPMADLLVKYGIVGTANF